MSLGKLVYSGAPSEMAEARAIPRGSDPDPRAGDAGESISSRARP